MNYFEVGHVTTPLPASYSDIHATPVVDAVSLVYPSRLEAMALDPSQIALREDMKYPAGQIDVCVNVTRKITVERTNSGEVEVVGASGKSALVRHAGLLMKQALNYDGGLAIEVTDDTIPRHCGFGSSSSTIAGVLASVNELFGKPVRPLDLVRFSAQNHGEEIDGDDRRLTPVQCIGGSAICGMFDGSLIVVAGESTPIYRGDIADDSLVVVGVPKDFEHPDSDTLMRAELDNMNGFVETGSRHGQKIAYRVMHEVLPGLVGNDFEPLKQLIFDYRWRMGSIANCSFVYPPMLSIAEELAHHETEPSTSMIALSSVGPGFFAITTKADQVAKEFETIGMRANIFEPWSSTYRVVSRRAA